MSKLLSAMVEVKSFFDFYGDSENSITNAIALAFSRCPELLRAFVKKIFPILNISIENCNLSVQNYSEKTGITDLEITNDKDIYIIVEAKRGWVLPGAAQLTMYSTREIFVKSPIVNKAIVTMSECSQSFAGLYLPFSSIGGIPIFHISWSEILTFARNAIKASSNNEKRILAELITYLGGMATVQKKDSNWVYVVSVSRTTMEGSSPKTTYLDIVEKYGKYFHPVGGARNGGVRSGGWPKNPPNYIAFRYDGKLQSIHHIDSYVVETNMHNIFPSLSSVVWEPHYVYTLGEAIRPQKVVNSGKTYRAQRVWAMLDTLLTSDTITEARDKSYSR